MSVLGSSSRDGAGAQHSPRSPSRLRYVRKESAGGGGISAPAQQQLPDFLQVQELPAGILREVRACVGCCLVALACRN